ncbi:AAA family ATPase [Sphingorhabdus sp. EL138]|uniref:chromosome segregation SMC family protein n=1 Tax=Sphingorhabdus sp. EL138 TaxID=2073156 RepID=UPI0025F1D37D|nr:AAA family ATPase [Sphingorhabdus sp. EL138]
MRIKKLKLVGFKSFVEPAELRIESGLTGIVGPNGCGKSNLLEAIRWVMGESSAKSMRGAGMEDVIFAGTASRPPRDFAEVTILAERSDDSDDSDSDEELEVTRRIERGAGSAYRSNGRDVRAKDVALIFADAATGAHSPALVSQGRIGAIISAKPQERRQMLEEAAGISGLHVRRKDAEQKLRAAESNLARLATILADMDARAGQLRRQAKQAERYRTLTKDILQAEARLIFVRWREAKAAADVARAEANTAAKAVEDASVAQRVLTEKQQEAVRQLADARALAMAARDAASELSNKLVQLTGEHERIIQRQSDLAAQAARMADDGAREGRLTHDAADALARLQAESVKLADQIKAQEEERPALLRTAENAERQARESEIALANASAEQARADAELRVADAALAAATTHAGRAEQICARIANERDDLGDEAEYAAAKNQADADVQKLQTQLQAESNAHEAAEAQRAAFISARDLAQVAIASAKAELAALLTEQSALQRSLTKGQGNKAIDRISVKPGYERALAAALGDDADASIGGETGRRWLGGTAALGTVADTALIHFVNAPAELAARLSMVRVADTDDGQALVPGERLVTLAGGLRRWDGFATDGDGATIAEQLVRANRLAELNALIAPAQAALDAQAQSLLQMTDQIEAAQDAVRKATAARVATEGQLRQALRAVDQAEDAWTHLKSAKAALGDRMATAAQDLAEAQAERIAAETARDALPDGSHHADLVQNLTAAHEATRDLLARNQADLSALEQRIAQSRERRAVAMAEIRSWQERAGEAERRIAEMNTRSADIATEQAENAGKPEILARDMANLRADKEQLAEKLAGLQAAETAHETNLRALESELSAAAERLSVAREARAGAEARAENQEQRRVEMGRISGERFECPPPVLPEKLNFDEDAMDDAGVESSRLDRLQNERERIGPVNLIAADELAELEMQQGSGLAESEELTLAINRLRGSIGSLNREGRARMLTAFEAVDGHFRRLFSTLFNGGQAHLALIDSDDPLEAGLEIFAQPPGKKLQSLTLLSGGEQALTAVALIFGLFLTNPAPICVLDEVDAPLDDANIERFCDLLDAMTQETETRYLIVTHNAVTMSRMHRLFGVTMIEQGISRLVSVDLGGAEQLLAAE